MILKKLHHGNLKVCLPKNVLVLPLLIKAFLHQLNGTEIQIFIVYELDTWSIDLNSDFTLKDPSCGGVKLAEKADRDKYTYTGYGIGFDSRSEFSLPDGSVGKNVIIFEVDISSSVHIDNKGKDTLILDIGLQQRLDDTALTVEAQYSITFSRSNRKFCLSLHHDESNSFLFVKATRIYQFKAN